MMDIDGRVSLVEVMAIDNQADGVFVSKSSKPISVAGTVEITGGVFSRTGVAPVSNQSWGIDIHDPGNAVRIHGVTASHNQVDGIRVRDAKGDVTISDSTAMKNAVDGFAVEGADQDVRLLSVTSTGNGADGIYVTNVSAKGLATDFKVTVDDSIANGNKRSGVQVTDSERVLIVDSTTSGNTNEGVLLTSISDDVTIKRSTTQGNTAGIVLNEVNEVNLQFTDAMGNASDGLRSTNGSTIHATGGRYSTNGNSGWNIVKAGGRVHFRRKRKLQWTTWFAHCRIGIGPFRIIDLFREYQQRFQHRRVGVGDHLEPHPNRKRKRQHRLVNTRRRLCCYHR